jgi:hypothetical protein
MTQQEWLMILAANVAAAVATFIYHFKFRFKEHTIAPTPLVIANRVVKAVLVSGCLTMLGVGCLSFVWMLRKEHGFWDAAFKSVLYSLAYGTPIAFFGVPGSLGVSLIALMIPRR